MPSKSKMPEITVLMPVHNGSGFLKEAIQSIIDQTFSDFEFLIINDGSTDNSVEIIETFKDQRIRSINYSKKKGLIHALNDGIKLATGRLIARMDSDDISNKYRLEKQVGFLRANPGIDVLGCQIDLINEEGAIIHERIYSLDHDSIKVESFFNCPLPHPGVIFKKDEFIKANLFYHTGYKHAEDYELWQRALMVLKFANYNEKLLAYRIYPGQVSKINSTEQNLATERIKLNYLKSLNIPILNDEHKIILDFLGGRFNANHIANFNLLLKHLNKIIGANKISGLFNEDILNGVFAKEIDHLVRMYAAGNNKIFSMYKKNELVSFSSLKRLDRLKIQLKEWII